jgi:NitT/TauT family transport system permease protein
MRRAAPIQAGLDWMWRSGPTVLVLAGLLVAWEVGVRVSGVAVILLPAPSDIVRELLAAPMFFLRQGWYTLVSTVAGFVLAVLLGVGLAAAIVCSRVLDRVIWTVLVMLNSLPKVALAPLFVIWMGLGVAPKIAIAVLLALFSIVVDTVLGLRTVDPDVLALSRISKAGWLREMVLIRLPGALPALFAGMKVAISFALVGAIVGEFVGGSSGLGTVILVAQGQFDTTRVFAALVLLGVMGTALFQVVEQAERLLIPWHVSQRSSR